MPLVRIDLIEGRTSAQKRDVADAIHTAIVQTYGIPERDRFQVITEHAADNIIAQDAGLGFERTGNVVMVQIFTQAGRSDEDKEALYKAIHDNLHAVGLTSEDLFIGYNENGPQDWSFGFGRAQYLTGELKVPGKN
ncbi:tautomerase family protein [Pseudarthrobacter sp. PS3-L1]|uniref:tautomerase family protein n=1 Tax=Pseudarthrobacter sp. PS3-L1 TaxID=3046207 RepID=UPI0024B8C76C|nr:tautomerase family protein [Pseudarthrobacter sp. PS3-L1]MDJ0319820.1 tautomerase family protein [Pseudarthrobacter sp. PS3-L1]